jgi:hypothetical protein
VRTVRKEIVRDHIELEGPRFIVDERNERRTKTDVHETDRCDGE